MSRFLCMYELEKFDRPIASILIALTGTVDWSVAYTYTYFIILKKQNNVIDMAS